MTAYGDPTPEECRGLGRGWDDDLYDPLREEAARFADDPPDWFLEEEARRRLEAAQMSDEDAFPESDDEPLF